MEFGAHVGLHNSNQIPRRSNMYSSRIGVMELNELLDAPQDVAAWRLDESELLDLVPALSLMMRRCEALRVRMMHEIDQRCAAENAGASSPGAWLAGTTGMTPGRANQVVTLGNQLVRNPAVATAFDAGAIDIDHVRVILGFLASLPDNLADRFPADHDPTGTDTDDADLPWNAADVDAATACAEYLLFAAHGEDSLVLAKRARALKQIIESEDEGKPRDAENPDLNEFFASPTLGGRVHLKGTLDAESGELLLTALSALSKPRPGATSRDGASDRDDRTPAQRRAEALTDIVRAYLNSGQAPDEGGERPNLTVFVDANDLASASRTPEDAPEPDGHSPHRSAASKRGPAWMPWLGPISQRLAARISCDAVITPITMDDEGTPLDVGRSTRLVNRRMRRALHARDGGCAFPGCTRPAAWTEAHHIKHWSNGGHTKLSNLVLLCRFHHQLIHKNDWEVFIGDDGHPWFRPPRWIDSQRSPRPAHNRQNRFTFAA
ncbi:DUF222 domain-containing protein [Rhodococcus oryzae]|uniref:DUF222 domain-containing protein n=2 Tax=Rhodococcus oryzae TaxID=2571143 RepID=A0ABY2RKP7_9NOCA|nr:DUF222 domain-containing protein [Rhodococcus oryzae]